jgi:outer membrane protein TolC
MIRWTLLVVSCFIATPAMAQSTTTPLTLEEVLKSSAQHSPLIIEALAKVRQAEGRSLSAEGAFDTVFSGEARSRLSGYYDGTSIEGKLSRPFTSNGGEAYTSYRVSRGSFPIYEDRSYTNQAGEFKVGAVFALMRDRLIDERRTRLGIAETDINVARLEGEMVAIGVQGRAVQAYQTWVVAGLRLATYRGLLDLAMQRRDSIGKQVRLGAQPDILRTENEQNIVRRRALVVRTEIELATAANGLSLYFRDENGAPQIPDAARLPSEFPALPRAPRAANRPALPDRPDLSTILARIDQAEDRFRLAENDTRPRLDVFAEGSRDIGAIGLGGRSREGTEAVAGVRLSVPLERRAARGRMAEARSEIDALRNRRQQLADQIGADVNAIAVNVEGSARLVTLASEEAGLAEQMAQAERRRFSLGASDFLIVNLREESAADAKVRLLDAEFRLATGRGDYATVTANREALGLTAQ